MSRLRWPDSTNSVSEKPGTIQYILLAVSPVPFMTLGVVLRRSITSVQP